MQRGFIFMKIALTMSLAISLLAFLMDECSPMSDVYDGEVQCSDGRCGIG